MAFVSRYDSFANGQSKTGASLLVGDKWLKNILLITDRYACAGILYIQIDIFSVTA